MGPSGGAHALDCRRRRLAHLAVAGDLELVGVERDAIMFLGFEAQHLGRDVLERVQQLAVAGREQRSVRAGELDPMLEQAKTARPAPKKKAA